MSGNTGRDDRGAEGEPESVPERFGRRRYLAVLAAAGSTALAGCEDTIGDIFEAAGEVPTIDFGDGTLVQTVEDTQVNGASGSPTSLDDPPLVEAYNVAPVVSMTGENLDNLSSGLHLEVDARGGPSTTFELSQNDVQDLNDGADPRAVFTDAASTTNSPTVTLESSVSSVVVEAVEPDSGATLESTTYSGGSDYDTVEAAALRVGIVGVQDPDNGSNYGAANNGDLADFSRSARMAAQYLPATYPGGVATFAYSAGTITGDPDDRNSDYSDAYTTLQKAAKGNHNSKPNFPNGGTFYNETHMSDSDARSAIRNNGFDVTVLILPDGYYGSLGLYPGSRKQAVSTLEPEANGSAWDEAEFTHTVAQEIGHNLRGDPYTDPSQHPLAQRGSGGSDATANGSDVDRDHARHENSQNGSDPPGVTSFGYDLTDGAFAHVDSTEFDASGDFSVGGNFGSGSGRSAERLESFMSYSWNDVWTDARMHQELINSGFQRSSWGSSSRAALSGRGRVTDEGSVVFDSVETYQGPTYLPDLTRENIGEDDTTDGDEGTPTEGGEGTPAEETEPGEETTAAEDAESTPGDAESTPAEDEEGPGRESGGDPQPGDDAVEVVTVELLDPNGEALETAYVRDQQYHFHTHETFDVARFIVEFPMPTVEVRSVRTDLETRFNPVTRVVGDAVGRVPDRGFVGEAGAVRAEIADALGQVDTLMSDRAFADAAGTMDGVVGELITGGVRGEYEDAGSNQPFRADLEDLVGRMVDRLEALQEYDGTE